MKVSMITDFSDEILLRVVQELTNIEDIINLSHTCRKFAGLLQDSSLSRRLVLPWTLHVQRLSLLRYLHQPDRAMLVTSFTINDVYWIPSGIIRNIAIKLRHLRVS